MVCNIEENRPVIYRAGECQGAKKNEEKDEKTEAVIDDFRFLFYSLRVHKESLLCYDLPQFPLSRNRKTDQSCVPFLSYGLYPQPPFTSQPATAQSRSKPRIGTAEIPQEWGCNYSA